MADDLEEQLRKLENEKKSLEEKNKSLAKIIELSTKGQETKPVSIDAKPDPESTEAALEELRKSMKIVKKTLKESIKGPDEKHAEMKKMVNDLESKINEVEKIPTLETKMVQLEKRIGEDAHRASNPLGGLFGGFGMSGSGPSTPKDAPKNMAELLKMIKGNQEAVDTRILNMERRVDSIREKIGRKNLEKLEGMISAKQDISDNIVPRRVKEEVEKILSTFSFEVDGMATTARELAEKVESSNEDIEEALRTVKDLSERTEDIERDVGRIKENQQPIIHANENAQESLDEMDKDVTDLQMRQNQAEKDIERLKVSIDDVEKALTSLQTDYKLKTVLRSEISRLARTSQPNRRRPAARKPTQKSSRKKSRKPASRSSKTQKKEPEEKPNGERKALEGMISKIDSEQKDRIDSIMDNMKTAFKKGLITKARYDRITKKLNKLESG